MGLVTCAGRSSRCIEGKCTRGIGIRGKGIQNSRGVLDNNKKGIWGRRGRSSESGRTKEVGAGREVNERICPRVQEGGKRKWV